ncbi:Proteasome activator BLM10 [Rhodotorula toruloides]
MSNNSNFLDQKACEIVKQAIDADVKQEWIEAFKLYKNSLDYFNMAYKYEKNPKLKDLIRSKVEEYLERAEKLKDHIQASEAKAKADSQGKAVSGGGGGAQAKKGPGDDDDADTKKLRDGLSSAILSETPNVRWEDVAGLEQAKESLKEAVILPIKFPHLFTGKRTPWRGILLYGPPGTGKSFLAKAVATEAKSTFFSVSSSDLVSKWMGESERLVKQLFAMAREHAPSIIFIDEIDSLCGTRGEGESEASRRIKTEFLVQMNGVGNDQSGVLVLGATNIPWALDVAIKRRFEKRIYIPLPDPAARVKIFHLNIGTTPCQLSQADYRKLAEMTDGYSGSDLAVVVRDALMQPVRKVLSATHFKEIPVQSEAEGGTSQTVRKLTPCSPGDKGAKEMTWNDVNSDELLEPPLTYNDFVRAVQSAKPTVTQEDIKQHLIFAQEGGSELEDDAIQVDSPEQEAFDEFDDDIDEELILPGTPSPAFERANPFDALGRKSLSPQPKKRRRLVRPKEKPRQEQLDYPESLPYETESLEEMDRKLEEIVRRLIDCVRAKDYDVGFVQWNHRLECWMSLKYPMKRDLRAKLAKMYFELSLLPGMDARLVDLAVNMAISLLEPKKRIDISDLQLPWRQLYSVLEKELFPKQRKTGVTNVSTTLLSLVEYSQRFFPPHEIPAMLAAFLPRLNPQLNSIIASQAFCTHFLPTSHPQYYLPAVFKLWEAFSSEIYDEQWLDFVERLAVLHVDPRVSHPDIVDELRQMAKDAGQYVEEKTKVEDLLEEHTYSHRKAGIPAYIFGMQDGMTTPGGSPALPKWRGTRKDVGIFTEQQFAFIMTKCLRAMGVPVGGGTKAGASGVAASDFATQDSAATGVALTMKRPTEKLGSFAAVIVYSMAADARPSGSTPFGSKAPSRSGSRSNSPTRGAKAPAAIGPNGLLGAVFGDKKERTYLGGSKALDALAKLIQATEGYFHPSNYGKWAPTLGRFLQNVTWEFLKRWTEEQRGDCRTPSEWRLTPEIRREFVKTMRTVALLSMFSRDPITISNAQAALKTMALLEPDLVIPPLLERVYPSLETLTETHRTTACITALSTVSPPMISRSNYPAGAKNLIPLLELCLPGLDVNDPIKTISTAMFVIQSCSQVVIDDLTRPELQLDTEEEYGMSLGSVATASEVPTIALDEDGNGEAVKLSKREEDEALRTMTAGFPDWVSSFVRGVMAVFEALPEPGKGNRNGGKMEDQMTQTLIAACDFVCAQLSPHMFDLALDIVFNEVSNNVRTNSARATSQLVSCFARSDSKKTLAKFFRLCDLKIRQEMESGAGSTRSTRTNSPIESDATLHWWIGLLTACVTNSGENILRYKAEVKSLVQFLVEHAKSETSYTTTARVLSILLMTLTNTWVRDYRSVNADDWRSQEFRKHSHETWGRLYKVKDVKVEWHVSTPEEIDFAVELLRDIVVPIMDKLDALLAEAKEDHKLLSLQWVNDFCRFCNILRSSLSGIPSFVLLGSPKDLGVPASDAGDEIPEFIDHLPRCNIGLPLSDANDPRHAFVADIRTRAGEFLHHAVQTLKNSQQQDTIDCIKMVVATIRTLELDYPTDSNHHSTVKKSYEFALNVSRVTRNQKEFPRFVWVRRASLYHASRLRINSFYRKRSKLDDLLIHDLCELSLSVYLQVRKSAQKGLDSMIHYFDGTRTLIYPRLFEALKPGADHDVMKGALYVLGSKAPQNFAILDSRLWTPYLFAILGCQHQERPSVQNLIRSVTHDYIIRIGEPSTLKNSIESASLQHAADDVEEMISIVEDHELVERVVQKVQSRTVQKNEAYDQLIPELLRLAKDPNTHWRYKLTCTRLLRAFIRRDQPQRSTIAAYMAQQLVSELPNQRTHSMLALTKILHFVKLRTTCSGSDECLLLQKTSNPLRRKYVLERPLPPKFTEKFIASFTEPLSKETKLVDKGNTGGWLVWGDSIDYYEVPPEEGSVFDWDHSSREALDQLRTIVLQPSWWDAFIGHLAMEKTIDYLAADVCMLVKSIFQVFEDAPCQWVLPAVDDLLADPTNRHKQRAAGELVGGMIRGSKHWSLEKQRALWDWLGPKLPSIFEKNVTPETQTAWEMCAEYILNARDPRRNQPLVEYITSLKIDEESSEAFGVSKKQDLVGTAMKALGWHFTPWANGYIEMYLANIAHPYQEVRGAVADNLRTLCEQLLFPSYGSVEQFIRDSQRVYDDRAVQSLVAVDDKYEARIDDIGRRLTEWRAERRPASEGTSTYDKASMTVLTWIWGSISEVRTSSAFPFIIKLLPEFFRMQESTDNQELSRMAGRVLLACAALQFPQHLVAPLMKHFISLLRDSPSWRVRLDVLLPLQVFYYHHVFFLSDKIITELMDQLCDLLRDPKIEVREAAASTLSGIVRCSQRSAIVSLVSRFMITLRTTKIPKRRDAQGNEVAGYQDALITAHSAVLGISSLIKAFPYEVPPFIPSILIECMSKHAASPPPLSTTVRTTLADFKRTHQDSWETDQKAFTAEQLADLHDLLGHGSYYA